MRRLFSSPKYRRRALWIGGVTVVGVGIALLVLAFPGPKPLPSSRLSTLKADLVKPEKPASFAPKKQTVVHTAMAFIQTAVRRRDIAKSWDLVTPAMKQGYTKKEWASGRDLPVIRYPALFARWRLSYSYSDEVDLQVGLFKRPDQIDAAVFDVTLHPVRHGRHTEWLVDSFLPTPAEGGGVGGKSNRKALFGEKTPPATQEGKIWLFAPLSIFALLPAVLLVLGVRRWRAARVYRAYARGD